jgi:hypothetical protein
VKGIGGGLEERKCVSLCLGLESKKQAMIDKTKCIEQLTTSSAQAASQRLAVELTIDIHNWSPPQTELVTILRFSGGENGEKRDEWEELGCCGGFGKSLGGATIFGQGWSPMIYYTAIVTICEAD